jgi:transcriptional regulator with AAA-type ATPase domain
MAGPLHGIYAMRNPLYLRYSDRVRGHGTTTTQAIEANQDKAEVPSVPVAIVIFANHRPRCRILRWESAPLELGRLELSEDDALDSAISRKHLRLDFDGTQWTVEDLGSRNGTFVGGKPLSGARPVASGELIRVGGCLLVAVVDGLDFQRYGLGSRDGVVGGPGFRKALETVALSRRADVLSSLLISGESGSGKEIAARAFHSAGPNPNSPFVAVNCATIPKELAERLLFGSRRGAFSGATDAAGHVQAADGGTLFLDEIAELPAEVQSKLLRMLEMHEVTRLGATTSERVDVRVCAATWRNLRQEVAAGRFREDLYFRVGQPEIRLPALRERIEEIPWHVQAVVEASGTPRPLEVTAAFIEACALRHWPGNIRELRAEIRRCVAAACAREAKSLAADELDKAAGMVIAPSGKSEHAPEFPQDEISAALAAEGGNVLAAARRLEVHRNKVRRWLERYGVDPRQFKR